MISDTEKSKTHSSMKYKKKNRNISQTVIQFVAQHVLICFRLESSLEYAHRISKNDDFSEIENTNNRAPNGSIV